MELQGIRQMTNVRNLLGVYGKGTADLGAPGRTPAGHLKTDFYCWKEDTVLSREQGLLWHSRTLVTVVHHCTNVAGQYSCLKSSQSTLVATASGRIEPGSSDHMWPGCETTYPFSPHPTPQLLQGPQHDLYHHDKYQYCICCLPSWQLVTWIYLLFMKT